MENNEWKSYIFSDFVSINPTIRLESSKEYSFVEMKDLNENYKYVYPSALKKLTGGARFQEMDTLFARITPCLENGKICQVKKLRNGTGFGSTEFLVFRGKDGISDTDFVYYLSRFDEVRRFAELNMLGTSGRQRVTREAFDNLQLKLPPLLTQRRIADILSALDDKIELNRQTNATLEAIAQAIFKEWFVNFNFPGATGEMVESELGMIPKGWKAGAIGDILDLFHENVTPYRTPNVDFFHYSIPAFDNGRTPSIETGGSILSNKFKVKSNSILVSKLNPRIPRVWPVNNVDELKSICSTEFQVLVPKKRYFYAFGVNLFSQQSIQDTMKSRASGTSGSHQRINPQDILNIELIIPDDGIMHLYNDIASDNYQKLISAQYESITLSKIRDTLLPKLMSGEIEI